MPEQRIPPRSEIPASMTWDLSSLYADDAAWEADFAGAPGALEPLLALRGRLSESAATLRTALHEQDELERLLERLHTYAHLRNDEDLANQTTQGMFDRATSLYHDVSARLAWITPEIMAIPDERMRAFLSDPDLAYYRFALQVMLRFKPHTLSDSEERLLALAGEALGSPYKTFSRLNNADLRFPMVPDGKGGTAELSQGNFVVFLESRDRTVRKAAFEALYDTYGKLKNTLASTLDGAVKAAIFRTRARGYGSTLEASLFPDNVPPSVYDSLIEAIHERLPAFHRYVALRRQVLGLDRLDMYDMYVPLVPDFELEIGWEQAREWVLASLAPLGEEYCRIAASAFEQRWFDVLECQGKRSGAYSSGCYDSWPYMLLNYKGTLDSVFTLAHELGHSMHSHLANAAQGFRYADYAILVAEVASTTNEMLLTRHLLDQAGDPRLRAYLLNHLCDGFKGTVYRQVQFAEFERLLFDLAEKGEPLTHEALSERYYEINARAYGGEVQADRRIALEWMRIPHFYYNFYVYKYATGFSAAVALSEGILSGDPGRVEAYLGFLKAGASKDPLDVLRDAGVDLARPDAIVAALAKFDEVVADLRSELVGGG
jgi:oligoendopeptidase F